MNSIDALISKLSGFMALENEKTHEEIAGYIMDELLGDYDGQYKSLVENNSSIARIADLASDLGGQTTSRMSLKLCGKN